MAVLFIFCSILLTTVIAVEIIADPKYDLGKYRIKSEKSNTISSNIEETSNGYEEITQSMISSKTGRTSVSLDINKENVTTTTNDKFSNLVTNEKKTTVPYTVKETSNIYNEDIQYTTLNKNKNMTTDATTKARKNILNAYKAFIDDTLNNSQSIEETPSPYTQATQNMLNNHVSKRTHYLQNNQTENKLQNKSAVNLKITSTPLIYKITVDNKVNDIPSRFRKPKRLITEETARIILNDDNLQTVKPNITEQKPTTANQVKPDKEIMDTASSQSYPIKRPVNYEVYENLVDIPDDRPARRPVVPYNPRPVLNTVKPENIPTTTFIIPIITTEAVIETNLKPKKHRLDIFHIKAEYDGQHNQVPNNNGMGKVSAIIKSISDCLSMLHKGFLDGIQSLFKGNRENTNGWKKKKRSVDPQG